MTKKLITGVIGDPGHSKIYKSAKEGTTSFRITLRLLNKLWKECKKINNKGLLILKIPCNKRENFVLKCYLTKEKA